MKILVVDNMLQPFEPDSVPGGTERRNISDAVSLAQEGHEVFLTVAMPREAFVDYNTHHRVRLWCLHTEGKEATKDQPRSWQKNVIRRIDAYLKEFGKPEVVHYGCNSFYWLAKHLMIKHKLPLSTQIGNYLSGNAMYDLGRLRDLFLLKSLGANFVANTSTCEKKFQGQIESMRDKGFLKDLPYPNDEPLFDHVNRNNAGVGFVGNTIDGSIRSDRGFAVIAARADPAKKVGMFAKVKFPLRVFLKYRPSSDKNDYFKKLVAKLESNPNIKVIVDADYNRIMLSMSRARAVIVSWPDETFGLTAFEAASFGVTSCVFRRAPDDANATHEFLAEIDDPPQFAYNDREWKDKLEKFMTRESTDEERLHRAARLRIRYGYDDYVNERVSALKSAIRKFKQLNASSTTSRKKAL